MPGPHRFIHLGTADTGDIAHLLLLGLSPNSNIPEVDFSGACTVSRPTCAGTLTAFHILEPQGGLGGKPRPGDFAHAATKAYAPPPPAPAAWRASGHAGVARPRAAGHLWAQPVTAFAGARLAPRRAPLGHGGFTHDDRPIFEEEGFLLGLLLADDED